jgi:hypothetical protein
MRNHRQSICESAQKGRQVAKRRNPQAALGVIGPRERDFSGGITGSIAEDRLEPSQAACHHPSKDISKDCSTDSLRQIDSNDQGQA